MSKFGTMTIPVRKWLLKMKVDEQRQLAARMCKYTTLKSTATQLKKQGCGCWSVRYSVPNTIIKRVK